jgi:hypothetical protein
MTLFRSPIMALSITALAGAACGPVPTLSCKLTKGGAAYEIVASNPTDRAYECQVGCDMRGNDVEVTARCWAQVKPGMSNATVCEAPTHKGITQVTGLSYSCKAL